MADPEKEKHERARIRAQEHLERLRKGKRNGGDDVEENPGDNETQRRGPRPEDLVLNEYENMVALEMVAPEDIPVGFNGEDLDTHHTSQDEDVWANGT